MQKVLIKVKLMLSSWAGRLAIWAVCSHSEGW